MPPSQCHTPALMNSKGRASLLKSQGWAAEKQPLEGIRARFLTWNCGLIQGVLEPTVPGCKVVSKCISCLLPRRLLNYHFPLEVFSNHPILPEVSPTKSLTTFVYFLRSRIAICHCLVCLNPSTLLEDELPKAQDPVFLQGLEPGGSREILPE